MRRLIGRKSEIAILKSALISKWPELIVVYGRRRVGKTFLVRKVYENYIRFEFSGIYNVPLKQQLTNFHLTLSAKKHTAKKPDNWIEAFHQLSKYIDRLSPKKKNVIFIDEFRSRELDWKRHSKQNTG